MTKLTVKKSRFPSASSPTMYKTMGYNLERHPEQSITCKETDIPHMYEAKTRSRSTKHANELERL